MFKYPVTLNQNTLYARLGINPDATPADVSDARAWLVSRLNARMRLLQKRLAHVQRSVPGLQAAQDKIKEVSGEESKERESSHLEALSHLRGLENQAVKADPEYFSLLHEMKQLETKVNEINSIKLENPEARRKYDMSSPPCALLRIAPVETPVLNDRRTMLWNVRRQLSSFFGDTLGLYCYHPSDQTRRLFLEDFEPNELLDKEN